ncbi:MAG: hypothetical protein KA780_00935 [Prolixibacteraceae bacterium]|jgi:hypothetical protein|nr:hypothetical protein [Prolixibacteraceae bacterium]NLX28368.1 hypothetical protein [Bacteroidales bacterium]HNQ37323.1 hypothetical protein [Prolixibacteraceae bacterium]HPJ78748.1 hypothetical protein [Prolixibacteraceae bacterium]HRV87773.1 hypothetical protein [Prolixibacteraceae bacterium]
MALKFFSLPKPRQFDFKPRYYDPDKEEREERERRIREELGLAGTQPGKGDQEGYRPHIRGQFRKAMLRNSRVSPDAVRQSNRRILIIIAILALLFYMVFIR